MKEPLGKINLSAKKIVLNGRFLLQQVTGVQRVEIEILVALDKLATDKLIEPPVVMLPSKGQLITVPELKTIQLVRRGNFSGHLWEQLDLPTFCRGQMLWCLGNTAPVLSLLDKNTTVLTMIHDLSYKYFPSAYSWKFRALYSALIPIEISQSDLLVTVSNAEKKAIALHYPKLLATDNFHAVQNGGISDDKAKVALNSPIPAMSTRNYGIYVGSLSKRKNADGILKAAVKFLKTYPEMRFVVIGATSHVFDSFNIDIPKDVEERLEMRGQINEPDKIYEALKGARFLLFPSFYEASPVPPVEAMTFGCPVISSKIPSLQERCGESALYCDADKDESISEAIEQIMSSERLWQLLSKLGRAKAAEYSWKKQAVSLLNLSGYSL